MKFQNGCTHWVTWMYAPSHQMFSLAMKLQWVSEGLWPWCNDGMITLIQLYWSSSLNLRNTIPSVTWRMLLLTLWKQELIAFANYNNETQKLTFHFFKSTKCCGKQRKCWVPVNLISLKFCCVVNGEELKRKSVIEREITHYIFFSTWNFNWLGIW